MDACKFGRECSGGVAVAIGLSMLFIIAKCVRRFLVDQIKLLVDAMW